MYIAANFLSGSNNILIGNNIGNASTTASNTIFFNTSTSGFAPSTAGFYVAPQYTNASSSGALPMYWNSTTFSIFGLSSSIRTKQNVIDLTKDTSVIYNVRAREFDNKDEEPLHCIGYIAEEINEIDPDLVVHDADSCIGIEYNHLLVYAVEILE